jgi:sigma-E factor negative regulatory protein RseB
MGLSTLLRLATAGRWLLVFGALGAAGVVAAQGQAVQGAGRPVERSVNEWLGRMQEASRQRCYLGTFVVSSNAGAMASARVWRACDPDQQVERVETLSGTQRSTFRRNDEVMTLLPESRVARVEKRESLGLFPDMLQSSDTSLPDFYVARQVGSDRVAGHDADVVHLAPKDNLRFGYRVWSEKKSGLVVKLQTLDLDGSVLEQSSFSELQLDAPVKADKLAQLMVAPEGWRLERPEVVKTTAASEGWNLKAPVAGFRPMSCYRRSAGSVTSPQGTMQWVFSDGLASVSLFVEAYDRQRHAQEGIFAAGATLTLTKRIQDWWLTAVGEVPALTLRAFAQNLERRR